MLTHEQMSTQAHIHSGMHTLTQTHISTFTHIQSYAFTYTMHTWILRHAHNALTHTLAHISAPLGSFTTPLLPG